MKADEALVADILMSANRITSFVTGVSLEKFRETEIIQSAVIRELEVIGEAAKRLSPAFRKSRTDIPWKQITGMRDRLIHCYDDIDLDTVYRVATEEVPGLQKSLQNMN